jgi:hypothetical protein
MQLWIIFLKKGKRDTGVPVHAVKAYRVLDVYLHSFLTLTLDIGVQPRAPAALAPMKGPTLPIE